jgi:hypothetical protein
VATIREVLASRERLAMSAARIASPDYILAEPGQRPADPVEARAWDQGLDVIETYRRENGVSDRAGAFGPEPEGGAASGRRARAIQEVESARRQLRDLKVRRLVQARSMKHSLEIGL